MWTATSGDTASHSGGPPGREEPNMHAYPAAAVDTDTIRERIGQLQAEHHGLDSLIGKMADVPGINELEVRRLKKRKLKVKDTIILLQLQLEPDTR
jgi:hypothetical protein